MPHIDDAAKKMADQEGFGLSISVKLGFAQCELLAMISIDSVIS